MCKGTPILSLLVKVLMVVGEKLLGENARCSGAVSLWARLGENARCSGAVSLWARLGWAAMGRVSWLPGTLI